MKLSFACVLATVISICAFVAIFAMSVLIYENVNPSSTASTAQTDAVASANTPHKTSESNSTNARKSSKPSTTKIAPPRFISQKPNSTTLPEIKTTQPKSIIPRMTLGKEKANGNASTNANANLNVPQFQAQTTSPPTPAFVQSEASVMAQPESFSDAPPQFGDSFQPTEPTGSIPSRNSGFVSNSETSKSMASFGSSEAPTLNELLPTADTVELESEYFDLDPQAVLPRNDQVTITSPANAMVVDSTQPAGSNNVSDDAEWLRSLNKPTKQEVAEAPIHEFRSSLEFQKPDPVDFVPPTIVTEMLEQQGEELAKSTLETESLPQNIAASTVQPSTAPLEIPSVQEPVTQEVKPEPVVTQKPARAMVRTAKKETKTEIVGWPLPSSLIEDIQHLAKFETTAEWASATTAAFQQLNQFEITDPRSLEWLQHTEALAGQLSDFATSMTNNAQFHDSAAYMTTVAYRMERKLSIWTAVHRAAIRNLADKPEFKGGVIAQQISNRTSEINFDSIDPYWRDYLMLEKAEEAFANPKSSQLRHRAIAQKILARATSNSLTAEQSAYAQSIIGNDLGGVLRGIAAGQVSLGRFLTDLERYESKPTSAARARVNSHFQNYYWNRDQHLQDISNRLDDHYRNGNVRIELSQQIINSLIPNQGRSSFQQPVSDRILEASVFGQSQIDNQIGVQLVPDPQRLNFRLLSNSHVHSRTRAHARGFTFSNLGNARVSASKLISIGSDGISTSPTIVNANTNDRLTGINGQMDNVPLLGELTRRIAHQQQQAQVFQTKQIVENKLTREFRKRIDQEVQNKTGNATQWFQNTVLTPLQAMELEPSVIRMQTTNNSAVIRYRLASLDQNAADTLRPGAQPGSLVNFQLHSSAINNIANRIHINGKTFTPAELLEHVNVLLGRTDLSLPPEQQKKDVSFEFSSLDAINLDFQDGKLELQLKIKKLKIGKRGRWKDLIVKARYAPTASGQQISLRFDEEFGLRVRGSRLKIGDQLTVRTVFSALFKPEFQFNLLPAEISSHPVASTLAVSHLVLSDGWLGVSFNDYRTMNQGNIGNSGYQNHEALNRPNRRPQRTATSQHAYRQSLNQSKFYGARHMQQQRRHSQSQQQQQQRWR